MTTLALGVAVLVAMGLGIGRGVGFMPTAEDARMIASYGDHAQNLRAGGISGFLLSLVPRTPAEAFAQGTSSRFWSSQFCRVLPEWHG